MINLQGFLNMCVEKLHLDHDCPYRNGSQHRWSGDSLNFTFYISKLKDLSFQSTHDICSRHFYFFHVALWQNHHVFHNVGQSTHFTQNHHFTSGLCNRYIILSKWNWNFLLSNNYKEVHSKYWYRTFHCVSPESSPMQQCIQFWFQMVIMLPIEWNWDGRALKNNNVLSM